jgi:TRAP transporter TAXI family solute receptor
MALTRRSSGRRAPALLLVAGALLLLAACQPLETGDGGDGGDGGAAATGATAGETAAADGATTRITIATGSTGGVYYPLGGGIADVLGDSIEGVDATVEETNASVDNMQLIGNGGADLALVLGDTAADAVEGRADFEGSPVEACSLGRIYDNYTQVITSTDTGIATIEDLRGMRVSLGAPGSGTEIIAIRILEAAGIDPDADIERLQLAVDETTAALRDGTADAGFWSGGLPTGALVDYATTGEMVLLPTGEYTQALADEWGTFYTEKEIPAESYEGQAEALPTIIVPNVLVVSPSMPEDLQQQITSAIFDNKETLVAVHPAAEELDPTTAGEIDFIEICPGAQAYFDEQ